MRLKKKKRLNQLITMCGTFFKYLKNYLKFKHSRFFIHIFNFIFCTNRILILTKKRFQELEQSNDTSLLQRYK